MKLGLIGDPVEHSRSPAIQARLLRDAGLAGSYEAIRVPRGETANALRRLRDAGYAGCNVTSPLKEEAFAACDTLMLAARRARAVNTIAFGDGTLGTTTDGIGAVEALRAEAGSLRGREVLVLGTGPTAAAVAFGLCDEGVQLWLWGRNAEKASALCAEAGGLPFDANALRGEIVFSALTPDAHLPEEIAEYCRRATLVMDANYGERSTIGAQLARTVIDGSRMLEEQARASLAFWLNVTT